MLKLAAGKLNMARPLKRQLLVGARAFPDGNRELDGLKVEVVARITMRADLSRLWRQFRLARYSDTSYPFLCGTAQAAFRYVADVFNAFSSQGVYELTGNTRQVSQRILGLFAAAIIDKGTGIGILALGSHFDFGFAAVEHFSIALRPLRDFSAQFPHFLRDVFIVEQAPVIAVAGIHELIVDVTKIDRFDRDARAFQNPGLHGTICVMMIFDRGAGFYFDEFIALAARLEDIYTDQNIMRFEGRLEDRLYRAVPPADAGCALPAAFAP